MIPKLWTRDVGTGRDSGGGTRATTFPSTITAIVQASTIKSLAGGVIRDSRYLFSDRTKPSPSLGFPQVSFIFVRDSQDLTTQVCLTVLSLVKIRLRRLLRYDYGSRSKYIGVRTTWSRDIRTRSRTTARRTTSRRSRLTPIPRPPWRPPRSSH